jgi:hypothetical protein
MSCALPPEQEPKSGKHTVSLYQYGEEGSGMWCPDILYTGGNIHKPFVLNNLC